MNTKNNWNTFGSMAAVALALMAVAPMTRAQTTDALIDKLEKKGILTAKEASELRDEAKAESASTSKFKNALPDWVTSVKLAADFRGRFEENNAENDAYDDRNRYRYRLRLGATVT